MAAAAGTGAVPPPFAYDKIYRTDDEAYDAIAQAQNALGFPLSKKRSKANPKTGIKNRIDVRCHKSGTYRPWKHNSNQYQTSSRKSNCPFYVIIRFDKNTGGFFFEVVSEEHNHEPVENPLDSCRSRRQSQVHFGLLRLEKLVEARSRIPGLTSKDIAEQIVSEHPNLAVSRHDVLCMQNKLRRSRTGAFGTVQTFLDSLAESDKVFYFAADKGPDDKVARIFWIYHSNIEDWKRSPEVLMLDTSYKINRLKMPLLQISGATPLHTNFSAGFGLTVKDDLASFTWILKQLKITATKARIPLPVVVLTDFDNVSLKKASEEVFDTSEQQVCMWQVIKDVTLAIQRKWIGGPDGSVIMSNRLPNPPTRVANPPSPPPNYAPYNRQGQDLQNTPLELEIDQAAERAIQISWQALQAPPPPDVPMGGPRKFSENADGIRDAWIEVCRAETETEFWQRWAQLCYEFPIQKEIITYLHDTLVPERHQFAQYSVKWFHNFGIRMITRNKSSHLKDFFESSSTDLCQLEQHIWEMVSAYCETYEVSLQRELGRRQGHWDEFSVVKDIELSVGSKTMEEILRRVRCALDELQGSLPSQTCTGQFRKQMGLPCRHEILALVRKSEMLQREHIDRHWWLKRPEEEAVSLEQGDMEYKLVQVKVNYPPPEFPGQDVLRPQNSTPSRPQHASISRVQYPATRSAATPAAPSAPVLRGAVTSVPPPAPRAPGTRVPYPAHRADGRVPIPIHARPPPDPTIPTGRRRLQKRFGQSAPSAQEAQPAQGDGAQEQPMDDDQAALQVLQQTTEQTDDDLAADHAQPGAVRRPDRRQQQLLSTVTGTTSQGLDSPAHAPIATAAAAVATATAAAAAAASSSSTAQVQDEPSATSAVTQPTEEEQPKRRRYPPRYHRPSASAVAAFLQQQAQQEALEAQQQGMSAHGSSMAPGSAPAGYQPYAGMGHPGMYDMNAGVPPPSSRRMGYSGQGQQFTFRAWQPPQA